MSEPKLQVDAAGAWFAQNSDREPGEPQAVVRLPAATDDRAPAVRATYVELPQQPRRHALILSKPVWCWGGEMGVNECGVAIGGSSERSLGLGRPRGLLTADLVRLGLERGASAAEAAAGIVALIARHGHGGPDGMRERRYAHAGRWVIADANEAFEVRTRGGYTERAPLAPVHGAASYGAMAAQLRRHVKGNEDPADGGNRDSCLHAAGFFRSRQTTGSMIVRLRRDGASAVFTGTSAPCLSIFRPAGFTGEFSVLTPADREVESMLWRRHEFLHRRALADRDLRQRLRATRDPIEARIFSELAAETPAPEALHHADRLAAAWHKVLWESLPLQPSASSTRYWSRLSRLDGIV